MTMALLATVVDTDALLKTVLFAVIAGVGVTLAFSVAILGATRFAELRRDDRVAAATAAAVLTAVGFVTWVAAIGAGILVMTSK
jgi:hypothetical protein